MASPPASPIAVSPTIGPVGDTRLVDESESLKFRILIVGRSGTGKSSLINAIFRASLVDVEHNQAVSADVNKGITSAHNKHLVIHDSEGYEPGNWEKVRVLEKFIKERSQKDRCADKLHAIWLCVTMPSSGGPTLEKWHEKIFELKLNKVPIIVVYTKFDLRLDGDGKDFTEKSFKEKYGQKIERRMRCAMHHIPYSVVTTSRPETMQQLVKVTMDSIRYVNLEIPSPYIGFVLADNGFGNGQSTASEEDLSDLAQDAFAMAQRVDTASKIAASIKRGKKKYWLAIASGIHFLGLSLRKCLYKMHKDIVAIWNIPNLDEYLLSNEFCRRMMAVVDDLACQTQTNTNIKQGKIPKQGMTYLATSWANNLYKRVPEHIRCLLGYVVDLTLILQAVFQVSLEYGPEKEVTPDRVNEIIYEFHSSEKKKRIHDAIWEFTRIHSPTTKDNVADVIESLITENQMTKNDIQFGQQKPAVLLLTIIRFEITAKGQIINQTTLNLMRKILDLPEYDSLASELKANSDTELLLDFILYLFSDNRLSNSHIPDANKKARQLMLKLMSIKNVIPKSIFITDEVTTEEDSRDFAVGGLGRIFRGDYNKKKVTLKMFSRDHKDGSVREVQRVLAWRSLVHRYILPLWGIFEMKPQLFLVSPCMTNGTLTQWREKNQEMGVVDKIHRMIREVAEGVEYIHSEGIVHCDLRGENVFLDFDLHCRIADTGLTQYTNTIITLSGSDYNFNYAAPELFLAYPESDEDHDTRGGRKTMKTDVYAFGCLYYAIFFDTVPFKGKIEYQIMRLVASGERADRLESPRMEDSTWNLIQDCWKGDPSQRPLMKQIQKLIS